MCERPSPRGLHLQLEGIPTSTSTGELKGILKDLLKIKYDFLVILKDDFEDILWHEDGITSARVIILNENNGSNAGKTLVDRPLRVKVPGKSHFDVQVKETQHPTTMNEKYDELRSKKFVKGTRLDNIVIGKVRKVSCGLFDQKNEFETTDTWSFENSDHLPKVFYHGHVWPRKFQVS